MNLLESICPFNRQRLRALVGADHHDKAVVARTAGRIDRIVDHLRPYGVAFMVVEDEYVDHDYLDDFASYYSTCFSPPARICRRVHFFGKGFSPEQFREAVRSCSGDGKWAGAGDYLGFVVLRPLSHAPIGRTVLRPPQGAKSETVRFSTREYRANLFGIDLSLRSLAFQEQDGVLSSCATTAIWSYFQQSEVVFGTPRVTTADINRVLSPASSRAQSVPMGPLDITQMSYAFREFGLEGQVLPATPELPLLPLVYAYVTFGIPVVFAVQARGIRHAMPVVGYSIPDGEAVDRGVPPLRANRVSALYVHDDLSGPFSRLRPRPGEKGTRGTLPKRKRKRSIMLEDGENTYELLKVIIPTHHKIRLTYSAAHEWVIRATSYLWWSFQKRAEFLSQLEWDLRLRLSNDYKMELRKLRLAGDDVERVLCRAHPKYIWHARLNLGKKALVDMLFDATTVPDAFPVYHITWLDEVFRGLATKPIVAAELAGKAEEFLGRDLMALMS